MTVDGLLYDPTLPDDVVLTIDGPEFLATGWAAGLETAGLKSTGRHIPGCYLADLELQDACACQPPL